MNVPVTHGRRAVNGSRYLDRASRTLEDQQGRLRRVDKPESNLVSLDQIAETLVRISTSAEESEVLQEVDSLFGQLNERRLTRPMQDWIQDVEAIRQLPNFDDLLQDPFTSRAFEKPRGYAGDAVMMDYIYSLEDSGTQPKSSRLGGSIFRYTQGAPSSCGVRARREQISLLLDHYLTELSGQSVLAVASGHLREAEMSSAIRRRRFDRFVAFDADRESLDEVNRCYGRWGIETENASITALLSRRRDFGSFDFIYSTGLYDYLNQRTAATLTKRLFDRLNPGGRLVLANLAPSLRDIGYMEACMDWFLIYRQYGEMVELAEQIDKSQIDEIRTWSEESKNVLFVEISKL